MTKQKNYAQHEICVNVAGQRNFGQFCSAFVPAEVTQNISPAASRERYD